MDWQFIFTGISTIFSALAMLVSGYFSIKQGIHAQRLDQLEERLNGRIILGDLKRYR